MMNRLGGYILRNVDAEDGLNLNTAKYRGFFVLFNPFMGKNSLEMHICFRNIAE